MKMNKNSTITLNDRFSMLAKSEPAANGRRGRSRSRSRGRQQPPPQKASNGRLQGSRRNQQLLNKLDKQHKMKLALNLKSKGILRTAGRQQAQIIRNRARRAATIRKAVNPRNIRRNNLTTFVPLKDEPSNRGAPFRGRSRSRSRSRARSQSRGRSQSRNRYQQNQPQQQQQRGSVLDRLGVRGGVGRMRRNAPQQQQQRSRSRSRVKLNRNNFANNQQQQQLRRSNSRPNLAPQQNQMRRANSRNNLTPQQQRNGRQRGNSRARPAAAIGANQIRRRARNNASSTQLNRPIGGRIVKRTAQRAGQAQAFNQRRRGSLKNPINRANRGNVQNGQSRGRARPRNNPNNRGKAANGANGNSRRGRSRTRRGGANNTRGNGGNAQVSKAALDKQLDDYMSKGSA